MKSNREHRVPLVTAVIELLEALPREDGNDHVFIGAKAAHLMRRLAGANGTVHGFRSSLRDWSAERTNFPREVAEMALAHRIPDQVERAYRRGDLIDKRRRMMEDVLHKPARNTDRRQRGDPGSGGMTKFVTPKRALAPIDWPLAEYKIEELRARTYGDKPYTAVDAALLLHEARVPKIPGDDALRDLAWIIQVMRPPMRRRDQPQGIRLHDRKPISRREVARYLDTLHPWLAPAYRSTFVRRAPHWHDTAKFLAAWYRTHIDPEVGNSSAGPLTRFVKLLLERTGTAAVTTAAIQQCLSPSPSRRKAATKVPRHRHA
jgi:hypothetical protein